MLMAIMRTNWQSATSSVTLVLTSCDVLETLVC